jgi:kanamycin kinase
LFPRELLGGCERKDHTLGVADRWADLAVATWSTQWNYGPGWEQPLLAAYGVAADPERIRYYRLLWDLGP